MDTRRSPLKLTNGPGRPSVRTPMARLLSHIVAVFVLLVAPALCIGGVLPHPCDCGDGGAEKQCQHEDSCSDDPCETLAPQEREARSLLNIEVPWVPVVFVTWDPELGSARWSWSARPPLPPNRSNLPYAQSDRPLLI